MSAFDKRLTPARPDLAASHLRDKVEAAFRKSDGHQANDPAGIAAAVLALAGMADPPARLVLGEGTLERAEAALDARRAFYRQAISRAD